MKAPLEPIVLYDGVCGLCDRFVQFILRHDPAARVRFAPIQSDIGKSLLRKFGLSDREISFVVLAEGDTHFIKSRAVLRTLKYLNGGWRFLVVLRIVPLYV